MKSWHGPQETPNQNFKKNSLVHCQTSLVLSDAVWVETVSLKLVEEIAFAWASQTDHFKILIFGFFAFLSAESKILKQKRFCIIRKASPEPDTKK